MAGAAGLAHGTVFEGRAGEVFACRLQSFARSRKREAWSVSVTVSPPSTMVWVGETKELRALSRDRSRRRVEQDLTFHWQIVEGLGALAGMHNQAHWKAHRS
jgi:hypothetical protein